MMSAKLGKMLLSIASLKVGKSGVQPSCRNLALLTRLLVSPRLRGCSDFLIAGKGRFSLLDSQP